MLRLNPTTHQKVSAFFHRTAPQNWSVVHYLAHRHPRGLTNRRICTLWSEGLRKISACEEPCCNDDHRSKAAKLLERYNEQNSVDRTFMRTWLRGRENTKNNKTGSNVSVGTIGTIGTVNVTTNTNTTTHVCPNSTDDSNPNPEGSQDLEADIPADQHTDALSDSFLGSEADFPADQDSGSPEALTDPFNDSEADFPAGQHSRARDALTATFKSSNSRWKLSSQRSVESVMYKACMDMDQSTFFSSTAPSFILDVSEGSEMRTWFDDDEWAEILRSIPPLPIADKDMASSLVRFFPAETVSELRGILHNTSFLPEDTPYCDKLFDAEWADAVVRRMVRLWASPQSPLRSPHLEDWYTSYLWSVILDDCLLSLTTLTIERKEVSCRATARRRNSARSNSRTRARSGMKLDAVIRTIEDNTHEFGAVEVARSDGGLSSSKNLGDTWKLCRALRDMLQRLHERVDHDDEATTKIQVVGMVCSGVKFQMMRMGCWKGMVSVLVRENPMEVPVEMDIVNLGLVISHVQRFKEVIRSSVEAVDRAPKRGGKEDFLRKLMYGPVEKKNKPRLGLAPESP